MLSTRFWVQGLGSQCWVLGSGFRDWVLSAGFSVLGTRFWVQGQGSQCWVLSRGSLRGGGGCPPPPPPPLKLGCHCFFSMHGCMVNSVIMQIIGSVNLLENAPKVISEGLNFKIFPGVHAPRSPYHDLCTSPPKFSNIPLLPPPPPPLIIFLNEPLPSSVASLKLPNPTP